MAMCRRNFGHFEAASGGRLQARQRWLPTELTAQMKRDAHSRSHYQESEQSHQALSHESQQSERSDARKLLDDVVEGRPAVQQRAHLGRKQFGLAAAAPEGDGAKS